MICASSFINDIRSRWQVISLRKPRHAVKMIHHSPTLAWHWIRKAYAIFVQYYAIDAYLKAWDVLNQSVILPQRHNTQSRLLRKFAQCKRTSESQVLANRQLNLPSATTSQFRRPPPSALAAERLFRGKCCVVRRGRQLPADASLVEHICRKSSGRTEGSSQNTEGSSGRTEGKVPI